MQNVGGKDVRQTVYNAMNKILTREVAAEMNYIGSGGKRAFSNAALKDAVVGKWHVWVQKNGAISYIGIAVG